MTRLPLAQRGDAQLHRAGTCLPQAVPVAVALVHPFRAALAVGSADRSSTSNSISRRAVKPILAKDRRRSSFPEASEASSSRRSSVHSDQTLPVFRDEHRKRSALSGRARSRLAPPS
jgi:hypothetical protein